MEQYDCIEFQNLVADLEAAQNHFDNALGDKEVTKAIHELIVAETAFDIFLCNKKGLKIS